MHSKVIIASLACVMAASFANGRVSNASVAKAPQLKAQETRCCNAPNEDGINAVLYADTPYQNNDFCLFYQGLEYQSELASHVDVLHKSPELRIYSLGYSPVYGYYQNIAQPEADGDYFATFGSMGKTLATVYIYRSNGKCYGSVLSKFDARAKYYMNEVATSTEQNYYPQSWGGSVTLNSTTAINAVKHYGTYVYSGTSDMTMSLSTTQRSGWNDFGSNLSIKVQVEMYKNGTVYPVESARVRLFTSGTEITPGTTKRTSSTGVYTYSMNFMDTFNKTLGNIQVGVFTDSAQSRIKDNFGFDNPYIYTSTSSVQLFGLKQITYKIRVYPERSDRAAAYEISQAVNPVYKYTGNYASWVSAAKILYPAEKTSYFTSFDNYMGISANQLITIKQPHYSVWDAIDHEYGHYVSDLLNLSMDPSNDVYWTHGYNEDLIMTYDQWDNGLRMAYSEGLATYIGVAAQLDYATRVNSNSYCASIADEKYVDPVNGVNADFNLYRFGNQNGAYGQAVESTVAGTLIKLMDNVSRTDDNVALGHQAMWNAIRNAEGIYTTIHSFIETVVSQNPSTIQGVYKILDREFVPHDPLPAPNPSWTVMLYMCGLNTMSQMDEIESVGVQQPNDVNIIVETNINRRTGTTDSYLHRYSLENGIFQPYGGYDGRVTKVNMGLQATFQDFLAWGIDEYSNDKMGVILYDHGHGVEGVCFDGYNMPSGQEDSLISTEIATACANVFSANGIEKFEFIGYDACIMQVQDVAEYNSSHFKYQIASEEEESADMGWAYAGWVDDLFNHADIEDMMIEMCDTMVNAGCNCETSWGLNLSVLDLSKIGTYKVKFEQLASAMYSAVNANRTRFYEIIESTYQFGVNASATKPTHGKGYGTFDGRRFLNNLKNDSVFCSFESLINQVIAAYDDVVVYCAGYGLNGGSNPATGMSIQHLIYPQYHTYPAAQTHFTNWRSLFPAA